MRYYLFLILISTTINLFSIELTIFRAKDYNFEENTMRKIFIYDNKPVFITDKGLFIWENNNLSGWTPENSEMPNGLITDLYIEDDQFYMSTINGYVIFNGILTFKHLFKENTNLPNDFLTCMLFLNENKIYFGSYNMVILKEHEKWIVIKPKGYVGIIKDIEQYKEKIYVLTDNGRVYLIEDNKFMIFNKPWLKDKRVLCMYVQGDNLYLGTDSGVVIYNNNFESEELSNFYVVSLTVDHLGNVWAGGDGFLTVRRGNVWEDLSTKFSEFKDNYISHMACHYDEINQLIEIYGIFRSEGFFKLSFYEDENLNLMVKLEKKAKDYYEEKKYREAEILIKQILSYQPYNRDALSLLANIQLKQKNIRGFLGTINTVFEKYKNLFDENIIELASIYKDKNFLLDALKLYIYVYDKSNQTKLLDRISDIYIKYGYYEKAISILKKWGNSSQVLTPWIRLTNLYERIGYIQECEDTLIDLIEKFPNVAEVYFMLADFYINYDLASNDIILKYLNKGHELNPSMSRYYTLRGLMQLKMGMFRRAESEFFKALRVNMNDGEAHVYLAQLYIKTKDYITAKQELDIASDLLKEDYRIYVLNGLYYSSMSDYDKAITSFEMALKYKPLSPWIHFYLAKAYHQARYFKLAIKEYKMVLKINPNFPLRHEIQTSLKLLTG